MLECHEKIPLLFIHCLLQWSDAYALCIARTSWGFVDVTCLLDLLTSQAFERVARQWARSASDRKLDLFPLQRITSSDVILAQTSKDASCSAACQTVKILFAPREIDQWFGNWMEEENTPTKTFIRVAELENICLQGGKLVDNPVLRRKLFSGKQKTKTCQSLELLL